MIVPLSGFAIVTGVGACVLAEFAERGIEPARVITSMPGTIPWDLCDCGGYFAQTITRKNPTEVFPVDSSNLPNKGGCADRSFMWQVTAIFIRCIPGIQTTPALKFPTPAALLASSQQQQVDEYYMRKGITCYLAAEKAAYRITDYRVTGTDFIGPEGNCGGISINYSFQLV